MADEPDYTITAVDRETGEKVTYPLTKREANEIGLRAYGLDPVSFLDPDDDDEDDG